MSTRSARFLILTAAVLAFAATFVVAEGGVDAQRLRATVYLTQQRIPRNLTEQGLIGFARRTRARRLQETTDRPIPERSWVAQMVTAFNTPPGDLEFQVLFFDRDDNDRFIAPALSTMLSDRTQKTYLQSIRLDRPNFKPNHRMELRVTVRRQEVGSAQFELQGEAIQHSGQVDFSTP